MIMDTRQSQDSDQTTPALGAQVAAGEESRHSQHQWIVQSVNELKEHNKKINSRIDQVYLHLSDTNSNSTLACAVTRVETSLQGMEKQLIKLDDIDSKLSAHSHLLTDLAGINKKLEKLDDIDETIKKTKLVASISVAAIVASATISWFLFGSYLSKILESLHSLVLK